MSQRFVTLATAGDFSYCGAVGSCTKCKFRFYRDFITPIEQAHDEVPPDLTQMPLEQFMQLHGWREHLVEEMTTLPIADFMKLRYWDDHLRMAFYFINDGKLETSLLQQWLTASGDEPSFANFVVSSLLFHHHGTELADAWAQKANSLPRHH